MQYFYTYTLRRYLASIKAKGIYTGSLSYTTTAYYSPAEAGQELGVMPHHIDCVLKFADDGRFREYERVPPTNRFRGGGIQFSHSGRPKPIEVRNIRSRTWEKV